MIKSAVVWSRCLRCPGSAPAGLSVSAQTGAPGVPALSAGPQSAAPPLSGVPAGPQSATPGVPTLSAGPQTGARGVPAAPGGVQTGAVASQGAAHSVGGGIVSTLTAKIIAVVLAVAVVAGGTFGVLAATGKKLPFLGSGGSSKTSSVQTMMTIQSTTPTSAANAPGPNGAPPDSASFTVKISLGAKGRLHLPGNPQNLLLVMGHSDPLGGTVCGPHDTGQPYSYPDPDNPSQTDTFTTTCSGSYQGGKLIYTATIMQAIFTATNGFSCTITSTSPWTYHVEGMFTSPTTSSGMATESRGAEPESCSNGFTGTHPPSTGVASWTGTLTTTP